RRLPPTLFCLLRDRASPTHPPPSEPGRRHQLLVRPLAKAPPRYPSEAAPIPSGLLWPLCGWRWLLRRVVAARVCLFPNPLLPPPDRAAGEEAITAVLPMTPELDRS
ncbi:unnamed protein product, partial [Urochloa humidicola]